MDHQVSFVIAARNEEPAVLAATVDGIAATARGVWHEILIVDDASVHPVDLSGAGVTIIRNPEPMGVTQARRIGTAAATGKVLVWLDAHMTFELGWLEAMLREVDSGALLCTPWRDYKRRRIHCWGSDFAWCEERAYERGLRPGFDFSHRRNAPRRRSGSVPMVIGACYMMRRDAHDRVGGYCPLFRTYGGDEQDLSARVWLSGGSVKCVTSAGVGHLDRVKAPYPVSFFEVEFNHIVMIRFLFDEATAAVLEEFFQPLPHQVEEWLAQTDVQSWRSQVQARRQMSDREFFRRIAPRVPISFGSTVRVRRGHLAPSRIRSILAAEESGYFNNEARRGPRSSDDIVILPTQQKLFQAGVVVWQGRAIILPGGSETGRCALVMELVRAGAALYSDSYAVLDSDGFVHPYPTRSGEHRPVPAGIVASMQFYPGRRWRLDEVSPAGAALDLLANAMCVSDDILFRAVNHTVAKIIALQGRRGPAAPVARALLQHMPRFYPTSQIRRDVQ